MNIIKILFIWILLFTLSACGSDTEESPDTATGSDTSSSDNPKKTITKAKWLTLHSWTDFSMYIPTSWKVISPTSSSIPVPQVWKIELAITSQKSKRGFSNNLILLSQKLDFDTISTKYSLINNAGAKKEYTNYYPIKSKKITFEDGEKSLLYVFNAKYHTQTPTLTFIQTAYVCKDKAFFFTIALSTKTQSTIKYEKMLKKFTCK